MKKMILVAVAVLVLFGCKKEAVAPPQHLLSENEMTDILYDMSLLLAMKSYNNVAMDSVGINPRTYIYKKYKIDSLTLVQNHVYYASQLDKYEKMQKKISERLQEDKKKYNAPAATGASKTSGTVPGSVNRQVPLNEISRK